MYSGSSTNSIATMVPLAGEITVELQESLGRAGLRKKQIIRRLISPRKTAELQVNCFGRHQFRAAPRQIEPSSPTAIIVYPSRWMRNFWKIFDDNGFSHVSALCSAAVSHPPTKMDFRVSWRLTRLYPA